MTRTLATASSIASQVFGAFRISGAAPMPALVTPWYFSGESKMP